jgi:hypothetical protein
MAFGNVPDFVEEQPGERRVKTAIEVRVVIERRQRNELRELGSVRYVGGERRQRVVMPV